MGDHTKCLKYLELRVLKVKVKLKTVVRPSFLILLFLAFFSSCKTEPKSQAEVLMIQGEAQGTTYTIKYVGQKIESLPREIDSLLKAIDHSLSTYDTTSLITAFNRGDTIVPDRLFTEMVEYSKSISAETMGAFDPTIGPLIKAWGWGFSNAEEMDSLKVDSLLGLKGFDKLYLDDVQAYLIDKRSKLNFNAIAQGYSVDLLAMHLSSLGITDYYVELGGEITVSGLKPDSSEWRIGIDKPIEGNEDRKLVAVISLTDKAMATSGNYRKFYEKDGQKYSHTIDPESGYPVRHNLLSATVISSSSYRADALATAFMVMGYEKAYEYLKNNDQDEVFLVYAMDNGDYGFYSSPGLSERIEYRKEGD